MAKPLAKPCFTQSFAGYFGRSFGQFFAGSFATGYLLEANSIALAPWEERGGDGDNNAIPYAEPGIQPEAPGHPIPYAEPGVKPKAQQPKQQEQ